MTKTKLIATGVTLLGLIFGAAVQQGLVPLPSGLCPPTTTPAVVK